MNYVVFDLEWNQPISKEESETDPHLTGEIIQIGAVKLNEKLEIVDTFKTIIKPVRYTKMNSKVKEITKISESTLENGVGFVEAYCSFLNFCGKKFYWFTWGRDDSGILKQNLRLHKMDPELLPKVYNLQPIFGKQKMGSPKPVSLTKAVEAVGEQMNVAHDALNDAMGAALVCRHLDMVSDISELERSAPRKRKPRRRWLRRRNKASEKPKKETQK